MQVTKDTEMIELIDMLKELACENDDFTPEELSMFEYESGYYTCKEEFGIVLSDDEYDLTRLDQIRKIYAEQYPNKGRR